MICPNANDPSFDVDYGTGHGHVCSLCIGTGEAPNPHQQAARERKAAILAAQLIKDGILVEAVEKLIERGDDGIDKSAEPSIQCEADWWNWVALRSGSNAPGSLESKRVVVQKMRETHELRAVLGEALGA